jgi:hypothetical protein
MSRVVILVAASMFLASGAFADDGSSGCGLGWKVTKRKSLVSSILRNYTNAIGSNTSGMTSGTSGCDKHSIVKREKAVEHFVEANYNSLMIDMAKGEGEYVSALGYVMGCGPDHVGSFSDMTQKHYGDIFTSDAVGPQQLIQNLKGQIRSDSKLAQGCSNS